MTNHLSMLLDAVLGVEEDAEPTETIRRARARIAADLVLPKPCTGLKPAVLAAYAAKTLDADQREKVDRQLAEDPDAREDLAFALDLLADVEAGGRPEPAAASRPQRADIFREIGQRMRAMSGQAIYVLSDLVGAQASDWTFAPAPAFATRGTPVRTIVAEGAGTADGSSIRVTADREDRSCFVSVEVRGYPSDRPLPTLTLMRYDGNQPDRALAVEPEVDETAGCAMRAIFYEADLPATDRCALVMEGADGVVVMAGVVVLSR